MLARDLHTWHDSGIGGGVVSQDYFKTHFGLVNADGSPNTKKANDVSSNVVSVLQAGAFFGALGSAPISGTQTILLAFPGGDVIRRHRSARGSLRLTVNSSGSWSEMVPVFLHGRFRRRCCMYNLLPDLALVAEAFMRRFCKRSRVARVA